MVKHKEAKEDNSIIPLFHLEIIEEHCLTKLSKLGIININIEMEKTAYGK